MIFIASASLSDRTKKLTVLFIQDKTVTWDENSLVINNTLWDQYIVSKRIRDGVTIVCFGINWKPGTENEWLKVKHTRIFVSKQ